MVVGLLLICATVSVAGAARAGFFGFAKMNLQDRLLVFPELALLACVAAGEFVHAMVPGSLRRISPGALLGFGSAALLAVFAFLFRDYQTDHFFSAGVVCLLTGVLHAIPAALLGGFSSAAASRSTRYLQDWRRSARRLGRGGVLELHCPNFQAAHVLLWHTSVVPLSGAAGALVDGHCDSAQDRAHGIAPIQGDRDRHICRNELQADVESYSQAPRRRRTRMNWPTW